MKIEAGKYYRTRDGKKAGPLVLPPSRDGAEGWVDGDVFHSWRDNGKFLLIGGEHDLDLVAEWEPTGPVVTETVKRINPGIYGKLNITGTYQKNRVTLDWVTDDFHSAPPIVGLDAAELRAAAAVLTEIADALDEGATCRN